MSTELQAPPGLENKGNHIPRNSQGVELQKTNNRVLTQRAVLWLGQTCNLRCYFCYFLNRIADTKHPEHDFMSLDKAKDICTKLHDYYGCTSIDIQGGEPTIFPGILDLIKHCRTIGINPTLITNGLHLSKPGVLEEFKDAGIMDFLCSLHGIGDIHDEVVCKKGSYEKITAAIKRMGELNIAHRFNCTMSKPVIPILPEIAWKAVEYGANAVNYIAFNPFEDQEAGIRTHDNVAKYAEIKPKLAEAIDILDAHDIECNVRYLPLCMAEERHRKNFFNWQQLPYDHHEWDLQSWLWTGMQPQRMDEGGVSPLWRIGVNRDKIYWGDPHFMRDWHDNTLAGKWFFLKQRVKGRIRLLMNGKEKLTRDEAIIRARDDVRYQYHDACQGCHCNKICDGFHGDYANFFGTDEAEPITDVEPTDDPTFFIREQSKIVEEEDKHWALG
jgi:MoaA/NifB/PqqE/SkfB family radical SAM enzyme